MASPFPTRAVPYGARLGVARRADVERYVVAVAALAGAYYAAAKIGLQLAYLDGAVTALWPPVGVGIAALVLWGPRLWPAIVIGDLLAADLASPAGTVLGQTVGNTLEVVVAAVLLRRLVGSRPGLTRVHEVFALVACAAAGTLISATFGSTSLRLGGVIAPHEYAEVWRTWWLSDFSGALVVTPVILSWAGPRLFRLGRREIAEGVVLLIVLVVLAELPSQRDVPYIVFPVLIWAALRFGPRGASSAVLIAAGLTVLNTAHNAGPFVRASITDSLLSTQLFLATAALTSLVLAAVTAERAVAAGALRVNEERLRSVVRSMAEGLVVRDGAGRITDCNAAAERIFGLRREQLAGRLPSEVLEPATVDGGASLPPDRLLGDPALQDGTPVSDVVARLTREDGTSVWVSVSSGPVHDSGDEPAGVVTTLTDVTQLVALADEQAALRRIATLVASDSPGPVLFAQVTEEVGRLLDVPSAGIVRFDGAEGVVVGRWGTELEGGFAVGQRLPLDGDTVLALVRRTGEPARVETYEGVEGELAGRLRTLGYASSVAAPVHVAGDVWGVLVVSRHSSGELPAGVERRLADFAELIGQALANADAHEMLAASRARIVEAGDTERRRLERNLHDGAQQRLVALALRLRMTEAKLAADPDAARAEIDAASAELGEALNELRELARGIHPAVLTDRGLAAAVAALADRAPVPVEVRAMPAGRLPASVEAAAYYMIAEAITNVAKYARASAVTLSVRETPEALLVDVADDGIGGADASAGTGLRGIADRVEALDGTVEIASPPGGGTRIRARIPKR